MKKEKLQKLILLKLSRNTSEIVNDETLKNDDFRDFSRNELIEACDYLYSKKFISNFKPEYSEGEIYFFIAQGITNEGLIYLKESTWYYRLLKKFKFLISFIQKFT